MPEPKIKNGLLINAGLLASIINLALGVFCVGSGIYFRLFVFIDFPTDFLLYIIAVPFLIISIFSLVKIKHFFRNQKQTTLLRVFLFLNIITILVLLALYFLFWLRPM